MTDEPKGDLQFDRADFEETSKASSLCVGCGRTIWGAYYAANGRVICESCKTAFDLATQGSGTGRFARATLYGIGAGAAGSALWYAVRAATGYEVGLIAVAVGFMVGAAVRKGSQARGGWRYQALAMFLTYASIVSAYVPLILAMPHTGSKAAPPSRPAAIGGSPRPAPSPATVAAADEEASDGVVVGPGLVIALVALAFALPFLGGFQNIMGIVIIGIGVYEAWKLNKRQVVVITGPHAVGTAEHG
jgi:hypothetical protein